MTHYVPKVIQLMLIEQFNCDMKHSSHPIKISTEGPVNDKEYTLFSDHVAKPQTQNQPTSIPGKGYLRNLSTKKQASRLNPRQQHIIR